MSLLSVIEASEKYVSSIYGASSNDKFIYHNLRHTQQVVEATQIISKAEGVDSQKTALLIVAAWFHDVGYLTDFKTHEETSIKIMHQFLNDYQIELKREEVDFISSSIIATKYNRTPENIFEQIIADADLHGLGVEEHFIQAKNLKDELEILRQKFFTDIEWVRFEIDFLSNHNFYTDYARYNYEPLKQIHLKIRKEELQKLLKTT